MLYRADIDGLRALSVLLVIFYHADMTLFSGGFVGVDVFFVISGFLITTFVYEEVKSGKFTYIGFYKRRIARLFPALLITLLMVLVFGFIFYSNQAFDNLGKEVFFSSLGAANLLFGKGVNYFVQDDAFRPLIHLWSLGVEEQFYFIWPTLLILLIRFSHRLQLLLIGVLLCVSLIAAQLNVVEQPNQTYFYPHFRFFELLFGCWLAIANHGSKEKLRLKSGVVQELVVLSALCAIMLPAILLDSTSEFPGINAILPCFGAMLYIQYAQGTVFAQYFSFKPIVFLGLISYPLYLFHQPVDSFLSFFQLQFNPLLTALVVLTISIPMAWLVYKYFEIPVRNATKKEKYSALICLVLVAGILAIAVFGILTAKNGGWEGRFKLLNPFAYKVSQNSRETFPLHFKRGWQVSDNKNTKVLFVGDSLLQQYVVPFSKAMGVGFSEVDVVSRGGCVLLKGADFLDSFADISCSSLRDRLYKLKKEYDYIVISQSWQIYDRKLINKPEGSNVNTKWHPFLSDTISHFKYFTKNVIVIGPHLTIGGTESLSPTVFLSKERYADDLNALEVTNHEYLDESRKFFKVFSREHEVKVVYPESLWALEKEPRLHDNSWSFFKDPYHISNSSSEYLIHRMKQLGLITSN